MRSDDQPILPMPGARPPGPPRVIRLAIDARGFASQVGARTDNAAHWDLHYPSCAPHYLANFQELVG